MLDKARSHRRKMTKQQREEIPLLATTKAVEFVRQIGAHWPAVHQRISPYLHKGREKLGDAYSAVARVLAAQKEGFEDRRAEKKSRSKSARTPKSKATSEPAPAADETGPSH